MSPAEVTNLLLRTSTSQLAPMQPREQLANPELQDCQQPSRAVRCLAQAGRSQHLQQEEALKSAGAGGRGPDVRSVGPQRWRAGHGSTRAAAGLARGGPPAGGLRQLPGAPPWSIHCLCKPRLHLACCPCCKLWGDTDVRWQPRQLLRARHLLPPVRQVRCTDLASAMHADG